MAEQKMIQLELKAQHLQVENAQVMWLMQLKLAVVLTYLTISETNGSLSEGSLTRVGHC